jgi:hypothetical protein
VNTLKRVLLDMLLRLAGDRPIDEAPDTQSNHERFEVAGQPLCFHLYRKKHDFGAGFAVSVVVGRAIVLRYDCFGGELGHMHSCIGFRADRCRENRLWFRESTFAEQILRTRFELKRNLAYYLQRSPVHAARALDVTSAEIVSTLEKVDAKLQAIADTHR